MLLIVYYPFIKTTCACATACPIVLAWSAVLFARDDRAIIMGNTVSNEKVVSVEKAFVQFEGRWGYDMSYISLLCITIRTKIMSW